MAMRDNSRLDDTTRREEEVRRARHERERLDAERARGPMCGTRLRGSA
jgi:hypothetical protein